MNTFSKIMITGADGQLGQALKLVFSSRFKDVRALGKALFDLTNPSQIKHELDHYQPDLIINAAAYTAVDRAEDEPELARAVNALALEYLCDYAEQNQAAIIHFSTDYVFGGKGNTPFKPYDPVCCLNVYAKTKWEGEEILRKQTQRHIIIRTSWLYGPFGHNFLNTMLRLSEKQDQIKVVFDQVGTPTYVYDLAEAVGHLCNQPDIADIRFGTYHYSNHGLASWYDFAHAIFEYIDTDIRLLPVLSHEFPAKAKRPAYSVLDKSAIVENFNLKIPHWRDGLKRCLMLKNKIKH